MKHVALIGVIALGVFGGLLLWAGVNNLVGEWQREQAAAKRKVDDKEKLDRLINSREFYLKSGFKDEFVSHVKVSGKDAEKATVSVTETWLKLDYNWRLKSAEKVWLEWSIEVGSSYDAQMSIVDQEGQEVGGKRLYTSGDVWVRP